MPKKFDIYKDEFGNYHEVDEEGEASVDGYEDDEQDLAEEDEDSDDPFDTLDDEDDDFYDEDKDYANERREQFDIDADED